MNLYLIVAFLIIGFFVGYWQFFPAVFYRLTGYIAGAGLFVLLLAMGARIGAEEAIISELDHMGLQALALALGTIVGSTLFLKILSIYIPLHCRVDKDMEGVKVKGRRWGLTLLIVFALILGLSGGYFFLAEDFVAYLDLITTYALGILLLGVGIDLGRNRKVLVLARSAGWYLFLIPVVVALGSLLGAGLVGLSLGLLSSESLAIGAGFGWYSLSGIIITNLHSVELGTLAFLTNVFREILAILMIPLIVRFFGKVASIAPGGATTMDVTLPIIKNIAGEEVVIPAFISGVVLSFLVPLLVPLFINFL